MDYEEALLLVVMLFVIVLPFVLYLEVVKDLFINIFQQFIEGTVTHFRGYTSPEYRDKFDATTGLLLIILPIVITILGVSSIICQIQIIITNTFK